MVELNGTLLISILNFIILVAVLAHFCYKPMLKVMDDRRNKIRNDLDSAARSSAEAAKLKSDLEAELANAQVAAQGIVDKAVKEAKVQAQAQIDALEDLKTQVAALSCDIASKIISKNMTPDTNDRLIAESIARLDAGQAGK